MQLETELLNLDEGIKVVALTGRLSLGTRLSSLEALLDTLRDGGTRKVVLDLAKVEYADSAALGVLLHASAGMRAKGGDLLMAAPNDRLKSLFELTNTTPLLSIYPDRSAALAHLQRT